jgi:Leucine-rich repeat (LRR) protein
MYLFYDFQVHFNKVTSLQAPPDGILQQLKSLDISGNLMNNWSEINKLGTLPW